MERHILQNDAGRERLFFLVCAGGRRRYFYRFRLDEQQLYPDPTSRFQPSGPHGPSQVVNPSTFHWTDSEWKGIEAAGQVIYEMHVGTFTHDGTWLSACTELQALAATEVTVLEVMPVADFPGRFGWGYDGVNLFAPTRLYGIPNDFRSSTTMSEKVMPRNMSFIAIFSGYGVKTRSSAGSISAA
jgi:1,4-alpha-glucan branching enzyme